MRNSYKILGRKFEGKISLGRHRSKWDDNVKFVLERIIKEYGLDSFGSKQASVGFFREYRSETLSLIKDGEFHNQLSNHYHFWNYLELIYLLIRT